MSIWSKCLSRLELELTQTEFAQWIRPLQERQRIEDSHELCLLAPNRYVKDSVVARFLPRIQEIVDQFDGSVPTVRIDIGSLQPIVTKPSAADVASADAGNNAAEIQKNSEKEESLAKIYSAGPLNSAFTFASHVEGKSNQMARAAALQVGGNPGSAYNPLFLYGEVGLGKTHLMQAVGNMIIKNKPGARVAYVHSERFVAGMVHALQHNAIHGFKSYYRSLDALLIDDIQFFAGKNHSQEEFFHTFNTLLDGQRQVIITSDRFPKELTNVQERLISRFGQGLPVAIDPPELETRVAILKNKASLLNLNISDDVAFFIAGQIRNNVRELEGALNRVLASARFTGRDVDMNLTKEALRDLLVFQEKQVTVDNIQKTVAGYYKMRVSDLHSKRRNRQITRPRQIAMTLSKELTNLSLPDIGDAFGGRDHTTVIHACRKVGELVAQDAKFKEDYDNLLKLLS
ncbi:MAG: chromosomal replication initiator protein DnaA [Arenicellales bacterium WSBS_2016_MAG_OTU3]